MLRRQSLIALGIAIVLGLVAVYLVNTFLSAKEEQAERATATMTKVAVAAVPLEYGNPITPDKIKFVDYPTTSLPPGTFRSAQEMMPSGKAPVAVRPMLVNEPVLASKIIVDGKGPSIAALLPDGKRAASVRINDVSGVAGFIQPNDTVDVLITRNAPVGSEQMTDVLLQNIRVIAMDQQTNDPEGKPNVARTATLEVVPIDAQKLALAQRVGALSLVLRKPGAEQDNPMLQTVSMNDLRYRLYGNYSRPASTATGTSRPRPAAAPRRPIARPAAPVRRTNNVEVVRGTANSQYEVGGYGS